MAGAWLSAFVAGVALGASLIIAIGAQNAFVLRQGLLRTHAFSVAAVCVGIDWVLIIAGALGFGALVHRFPALTSVAALGGAAFLAVTGALAFRSALHPGALRADGAAGAPDAGPLRAAVLTTLAVSLLNPHVYLDTVVLLGSVASQYALPVRAAFVIGTMSASALWFFGLAFGARLLAPLFEREASWRALDIFVGCVMWSIAFGLAWGQLAH